jgi:cobyrinic acid a,c-diamide synthase
MEYVWTPPGTDITIRWRKLGWVPPSEQAQYQAKWKRFQQMPMRTLDDDKVEPPKTKMLRLK